MSIIEFLRGRGVSQDALTLIEEQKIDRDVVLLMDDSTLSNYIPSYGDRLALFNFCRNQNTTKIRKSGLLQKLRDKMKLRKENNESEETPQHPQSRSRPRQKIRTIELGWIHTYKGETKQVRAKQGGGTRKISMPISAGFTEILKEARSLFFPDGVSSKGHESEFIFDIWDFKQTSLDHHVTIGLIYDTVKLQKLCFYLATKTKEQSDIEASPSDLEDSSDSRQTTTEDRDPQDVPDVFIVSDQNQVSPNHTLSTDQYDIHYQMMEESEIVYQIHADASVNNVSDPEITFGPCTDLEDHLNDTEIYEGESNENMKHPKVITIRYAHCLSDMIESFSDPETLTRPLTLTRLLPDNSLEAGCGSGLVRDMYSSFWEEFYDRCTIGTTVKVPFIRHDFKADTWKAIARIFWRGYKDCKYIPIKLALPFLEEVLFGKVYSDLIENFLQFISVQEQEILKQALKDFSSVELDDILDVLDNYECRKRASSDTFPAVLTEIAHKELVQKPMFVIESWRDIIQHHNALNYDQLTKMYTNLKPTSKKVSKMLKFPVIMTPKQKDIEHHLRRYIREVDEVKLSKFLRFCTGSDLIVSENITVAFVPMSSFTRRPIGRTCGMILQLSDDYDNFPDFRAEFNDVLESNIWVMDIV